MAVLTVLFIVIVVVAVKSILVVPQDNVVVIERLGRYFGAFGAGFHVVVPFLDVVRTRYPTTEQVVEIRTGSLVDLQNHVGTVNGVLKYKVVDAGRLYRAVPNHETSLQQLCDTVLRGEIGRTEYAKVREERRSFDSAVASELKKICAEWGVEILGYETKNFNGAD